jgi:predicted ATPase
MFEFLADRIHSLSPGVRQVLVTASCFGCTFDAELVQIIEDCNVPRALEVCQKKGLLDRISQTTWRFAHDQFQQSAYSLIPKEDRDSTHLDIGRKLWVALSESQCIKLSPYTFSVVHQLSRGAHLIDDQDERASLAALLLEAGEMASANSSFRLAASNLNLGLSLLGQRHWRDHYHLSLHLANAAAEVEYCHANFERMDDLIQAVLEHARNKSDKSRALILSIYSRGSRNNLHEAIALALSTLKDLGFGISKSNLTFQIVYEMLKTKRLIKRYSNADILALQAMNNPEALAAMQIYCIIFLYTLLAQPLLAPIISMRMVQLTLRFGLSSMATVGFGFFAILLCGPPFNDIAYGTRIASLSLDLLKMFGSKEWLPRVYMSVHGLCLSWTQPLSRHLNPLLYAHRVGLGSGDIESAMLSANIYSCMAPYSSVNLSKLTRDMKMFVQLCHVYKQSAMFMMLAPVCQCALNLCVESTDPCALSGEICNEGEFLKQVAAVASDNASVMPIFWLYKLWLASYFQNYLAGATAMDKLMRCDLHSFPVFLTTALYFHEGLVSAALARGKSRWRIRRTRYCCKQLRYFASHNPQGVTHKVRLLEAELDYFHGRMDAALKKYDDAYALASQEQLWNDMGLACECAAKILHYTGRTVDTQQMLHKASDAYQKWGATVLVQRIEQPLS